MKTLIVLALICVLSELVATQTKELKYCENKCQLPQCKCSTTQPPIKGKFPQFVVLSFDDAATKIIYDEFIKPVFVNRKNPDGCPISGTFFVPHEYTDYKIVNNLYGHGFEIGVHSITKNWSKNYWQNATIDIWTQEMEGQRQIISNFANISKNNIIGVRVPQLQLNEHTFEALHQAGFAYDSSWPTMETNKYFPYTLDYISGQVCHVNNCQTTSTPGLWELPIVDWVSQDGAPCNSIDACATFGTANDIYEWMKQNFLRHYNNENAPFNLRVNYAWFIAESTHATALKKFLDYLANQTDVYIISGRQLLNWSKNPTEKFNSCQKITPAPCSEFMCRLHLNGAERYFSQCKGTGSCPRRYPWLGNPLGQ